MKKILILSTVAVLTLSLGAVAFAANTNSSVDLKSNVKDPGTASVQTISLGDNSINQTKNPDVTSINSTTNNFTQMIELEKLRLQQAIDNGGITQEQANNWRNQIQQMEGNYNKNGTTVIPGNSQALSSERFKQMIEVEKNRLQQAIDRGIINKTQEDFWRSQIDLMEQNYKNNNFRMSDICLSFYDDGVMLDENYNYNNKKSTHPTTNKMSSNTSSQSTYTTTTINNTQNTGASKTNNKAISQTMQRQNMNYNNFNDCASGNWNTRIR